jgi:hypothetical protein
MNKNKIYIGIFAVLLLVYVLVKFVFNTAPESNVDMTVLQVDTANINSIHILQTKKNLDLKLDKNNKQWYVSQMDKKYKADDNAIKGLLSTLSQLKIENIAATSEAKWKEFQLTDSLATEIQLFDTKGKITKDLMIGKFNYKPNNQNNMQMYGKQNTIQGSSYVRLAKGKMSYLVNGVLSMTFGRDINGYRDKALVRLDANSIDKIAFDYPADSGFVLQKADSALWMVNKDTSDFKKVNSFLRTLSNYRGSRFENNFHTPSKSLISLSISGESFEPVKIYVYEKDSLNYVVHSTYNEEANFIYPKKNGLKAILKKKEDFIVK